MPRPATGCLVAGLVLALLLARAAASAQEPDSAAAADTLPGLMPGPAEGFMVDTILVVEDVQGLVWRDWYVNPEVGTQVAQAIERKGQLSGRSWLQSAAPIRNLALGKPSAESQTLSFVDMGEALNFWSPGEVEYDYVFEGPFGLRTRGTAISGKSGATDHLVRIPLPIREPSDWSGLETRERVGRLDITYRTVKARAVGTAPRGRFSVYLYYLNPQLGYRIVGVGF